MWLLTVGAATLIVCLSVAPALPTMEFDPQDPGHFLNLFLIEVADSQTAERVARDNGFQLDSQISELGLYVLRHPEVEGRSKRSAESHVDMLKQDQRVRFVEQQKTLKRVRRTHKILHDKQLEFPIREVKDNHLFYREPDQFDTRDGLLYNDEFFDDQWYLSNHHQTGGKRDIDLDVLPVWQQGFHGEGVVVTTLDDGVDHEHPDLRNNYDPEASADFNDKSDRGNDPTPDKTNPANSHGTRCAGEIAAAAGNGVCGVGVAYGASIGGIRLLDGAITDQLEAKALIYHNQHIHIYSASWGPHDDGSTMEAPGKACVDALRQGVQKGRGGLGSLFIWATGNGGGSGDMCGADGYVSSIESISVQSLSDQGTRPFFGESCSSTMISVPSGGEHTKTEEMKATYKIKVVTTDIDGGCVENFEGTSSAAPLASGVYALVLQANPRLTWRDVQHITVKAARVTTDDDEWWINGANHHLNPQFGFGMMDATRMVDLAQNWVNMPEQHTCVTDKKDVSIEISAGDCGTVEFQFDGCRGDSERSITNLEHVQLTVLVDVVRRGDVQIYITSPAGTRSALLTRRPNDGSDESIDFTFMTVHSWMEDPDGNWSVEVCYKPDDDKEKEPRNIKFKRWQMTAYGYHDNDKRKSVSQKARKPSKEELQKIMNREFRESRSVSLRSVDQGQGRDSKVEGQVHSKIDEEKIKRVFNGDSDSILSVITEFLQGKYIEEKQKLNNFDNRAIDLKGNDNDYRDMNGRMEDNIKREILEVLLKNKLGDMTNRELEEEATEIEKEAKMVDLIEEIEKYLKKK
ncbi:PC3-like endoprotease variant B [Mya arenaria]|uniref:PC3-like endoprotease variant B n=1 Tax=Mya arenaria TaxID=6604 RepID=UPI0022E958E5|nr:PC3-like endoprotease variant B [Mya arenaria]